MKITCANVRKLITFENTFLFTVILVVWILFSLPVFFFYISYEESGAGWLGNITEFVKLLDSSCSSNYSAEIEDCEIQSTTEVNMGNWQCWHVLGIHEVNVAVHALS